MAVALLLDKRQTEVTTNENENQNSNNDDKDSICSGSTGVSVFQQILMNFLDNDAPVLGIYFTKFFISNAT